MMKDSADSLDSVLDKPRLSDSVSPIAGDAPFAINAIIENKYRILSILGTGGFGCVYRVAQLLISKEFALKTLSPMKITDTALMRFRQEAQAAARLQHPNLVRAIDFGMIKGVQPYLVMDLVTGETLAECLSRKGRLSLGRALDLIIPVAQGLGYAHESGVVHRDIKPGNIMLSKEEGTDKFVPKILDFGIAKIQHDQESNAMSLTGTGDIFGSPLYMSPEQCNGLSADGRSDIYSLGCVLFEALTGSPPFRGSSPVEVMLAHATHPTPSMKEASLGLDFPPNIEKVIRKMMTKDVRDRYQSCDALVSDLLSVQRGDSKLSTEVAETFIERKPIKEEKPRFQIAVLIACAIAAGTGLGFWAGYASAPRPDLAKHVEKLNSIESAKIAGLSEILDMSIPDAKQVHFSQIVGNERVFKFPSAKSLAVNTKNELGLLYYFSNGAWQSVPAADTQKVPAKAPLIMECSLAIVEKQYLWGMFHPSELIGVSIDLKGLLNAVVANTTIDEEALEQDLRQAVAQDNLRYLRVHDQVVTPKAFEAIGASKTLRWLDLVRVRTHDTRKLVGTDLQILQNLKQLKVLTLGDVADIRSLLKGLRGGEIRRLSIEEYGFTKDDELKSIGDLTSIDSLEFGNTSGLDENASLFENLAKLPRLKHLAIDASIVTKQMNEFKNLKHLETIEVIGGKDEDRDKRLKRLLPNGCIVQQVGSLNTAYFSPTENALSIPLLK